ncbi:MAG: ABC transporter permease DevC [Xenococcus sp. (in: cyanobacteria)]
MIVKNTLAWLQLTREKSRLAVAMAGVAFSNILMFMQLGFESALYDSNARLHYSLDADLVMVSTRSQSLAYLAQFSSRRLYEALGVEGVDSVSTFYIEYADWRNPFEGNYRPIFVIGVNPDVPVFNLPGVKNNIDKIKLDHHILFDRNSRSEFGPIAEVFEQENSLITEVSNYKVKTVGLFTLGPSFAADGNLITSDTNFHKIFSFRKKEFIDLGLIRLEPGYDAKKVQQKLQQKLAKDVVIYTYQEFVDFEIKYWQTSTPIGFMFRLGTIVGFVVGIIIVYQIIYTDVSDHLPEYATLKAMGYTDKYLLILVFQESLVLAFLGYIPGIALSLGLYELAKLATLLPMSMNLSRAILVLGLTSLMCCFSGAISASKLRQADPADIF